MEGNRFAELSVPLQVKQEIIGEIEENLIQSTGTSASPKIGDAVAPLCVDKDCNLTKVLIDKIIHYGLDYRLRDMSQILVKEFPCKSFSFPVEVKLLPKQQQEMDITYSNMEVPASNDSDFPLHAFDNILKHIKSVRPELASCWWQLAQLDSDKSKASKRLGSTSPKQSKERLGKSSVTSSQDGVAENVMASLTMDENQLLVLIVLKAVRAGSVSSYLVAISSLFEAYKKCKSTMLPIGNLLASLHSRDLSSSAYNPFLSMVDASSPLSSTSAAALQPESDKVSPPEIAIDSEQEEGNKNTRSNSQEDEDDMTEEDMLAQAMALSMANDAAELGNIDNNDEDNDEDDDNEDDEDGNDEIEEEEDEEARIYEDEEESVPALKVEEDDDDDSVPSLGSDGVGDGAPRCHNGHKCLFTSQYEDPSSSISGMSWGCDMRACSVRSESSGVKRWRCDFCDYDVCVNCYPAPLGHEDDNHEEISLRVATSVKTSEFEHDSSAQLLSQQHSTTSNEPAGHLLDTFISPMSSCGILLEPEIFPEALGADGKLVSLRQVIISLFYVISVNCDKALREDSNLALRVVKISGGGSYFSKCSNSSGSPCSTVTELSLHNHPSVIMLLDYLLQEVLVLLTDVLDECHCENGEDDPEKMFLYWTLAMVLKILRTHFTFGKGQAEKKFGNVLPLHLDLILSNLQVLMSETGSVSTPSSPVHASPDAAPFNCSNDEICGDATAPTVDNKMGRNYFNWLSCGHAIRVNAMECYVAGLSSFMPQLSNRQKLFHHLVEKSTPTDDVFLTLDACPLGVDKAWLFKRQFYDKFLFQKLCAAAANGIFDIGLELDSPGAVILSSDINSSNVSRASSASDFLLAHDKSKDELDSESSDCSPSVIMQLLMKRLDVSKASESEACKSMIWGELTLMMMLHSRLITATIGERNDRGRHSIASASSATPQFDSVRYNSLTTIGFGSQDTSVFHVGPRAWTTVVACGGIMPKTGIHEFTFRIDHCEKGHVFLGMITASHRGATVTRQTPYYLGQDRHSWGLIGTRALWHNKSKINKDYGTGFDSESIIKMRYDSNAGTISYAALGADWGVGFTNISSTDPLYPAVSLHESEDKISFVTKLEVDTTRCVPQLHIHAQEASSSEDLILYGQTLIARALSMISSLNSNSSVQEKAAVFDHPYFGLFVPSLCAALVRTELKLKPINVIALHLLPQLIILSRQLAALFANDTNNSYMTMAGDWIFRSSPCDFVPGQEYRLLFEDSSDLYTGGTHGFTGRGTSTSACVTASGAKKENKVKFQEIWDGSGECLVEGRTSLCGSFFSGRYRDPSSDLTGTIEGIRIDHGVASDGPIVPEYIDEVVRLSVMAVGKLSAQLFAMDPIVSTDLCNSQDSPMDCMNVDSPAVDCSRSTSSNSINSFTEDAGQESSSKPNENSGSNWIESELFSGGLPNSVILDFVTANINALISSIGTENTGASPTISWFVDSIFPFVVQLNKAISRDFCAEVTAMDTINTPSEFSDVLLPQFISDLLARSAHATAVDDIMLQHTNTMSFTRIGGEILQTSRRLVLAALVKHSGSSSLCVQINGSQPSIVQALAPVWRAHQKIIEHIIRIKQSSGQPYSTICKLFIDKAEFLLKLLPSEKALIYCDVQSADAIQMDFSTMLSQIVEFFLSTGFDTVMLRSELLRNGYKCLARAAGFQSLYLLFSKSINDSPQGASAQITSISLQATLLEYVSMSIYGMHNAFADQPSDAQSSLQHYSNNIHGVNSSLRGILKQSFENIYEFITQMLARSTWASHTDGQSVGLCSWALLVRPDDHQFMNRVGIFRVLQTVLDETRSSDTEQVNETHESTPSSRYALEFYASARQRVSQMVLRIVLNLASQVAYAKNGAVVDSSNVLSSSAPKLQKIVSGPDTLSQSLFEVLYAELYCGFQRLVSDVFDKKQQLVVGNKIQSEGGSFIGRDQFVCSILKLLMMVSTSKVCQKSVCTPKWISLLVSGVGCGSANCQRKTFRLLRRLLCNIEPDQLQVLVPDFFSNRDEFCCNSPLDEAGVLASIDEQSCCADGTSRNCTERLIYYLLECFTVYLPPTLDNHDDIRNTISLLNESCSSQSCVTLSTIATEALLLIRVLSGISNWRAAIYNIVESILTKQSSSTLRLSIAALCVTGGHIDRLRPGGMVFVKPYALVGPSDQLSNKMAGAMHSSAMFLGQSSSTGSIEVVLMDRGMKVTKQADETSVLFTTSIANTSSVKTVRLSISDIVPHYDIPVLPDLIPVRVMLTVSDIVMNDGLAWLRSGGLADTSKDEESKMDIPINSDEGTPSKPKSVIPTELEMLHAYHKTSVFKSMATSLQYPGLVEEFLRDHSELLEQLIEASITDTRCGSLCILESAEERWTQDWATYMDKSINTNVVTGAGTASAAAVLATTSTHALSDSAIKSMEALLAGCGDSDDRQLEQTPADVIRRLGRTQPGSQIRSQLLEAAAAVFAPNIARSSHLMPPANLPALVAQMQEMGLPAEWCEVALRRCRFNVEMAINLCFETGDDMARLVAEDQMLMASQQSQREQQQENNEGPTRRDRERERDRFWRIPPPSADQTASMGDAPAFPNLGFISSRLRAASGYPPSIDNQADLEKPLLEMGIPPSWCRQALSACNNNVTAAIKWVAAHAEELMDTPSDENPASAEPMLMVDVLNPLSHVSGQCEILGDLTCITGSDGVGGFPSVGCRMTGGVSTGKWYYEVALLTAGCIQIGWADSAFTGAADDGRGVGDDSHSWAYDGWRSYLWNEISTDWGARWSTGDIVGCALDMDNKIMSFYLNGFGREIDMGDAFKNFSCSGSMYPCISLSRKEKIQFNFGSTPFKFPVPKGYSGYVDHVTLAMTSTSHRLDSGLSNQLLKKLLLQNAEARMNGNSNHKIPSPLYEDSFEQSNGDKVFSCQKRYFPNDQQETSSRFGGPSGGRSSMPLPQAEVTSRPSSDPSIAFNEFVSLSRDISVLHCRLMILRVLHAFPSLSIQAQKVVVGVLVKHKTSNPSHLCLDDLHLDGSCGISTLESMLILIRLSSVNTNRTRVYQSVMALLPSRVTAPQNLGSIAQVGGSPTLEEMKFSFRGLLQHMRQDHSSNHGIINSILDEIFMDTTSCVQREVEYTESESWLPLVLANKTTNLRVLNLPALHLAFWYTSILIEQFAADLASDNSVQSDTFVIGMWMYRLCQYWSFALRTPAMKVKHCVIVTLSSILQESRSPRFQRLSTQSLTNLMNCVPLSRLKMSVVERLEIERLNLPLCSEYLQSMMELMVLICQSSNSLASSEATSPNSEKIIAADSDDMIFCECEHDFEDPNFNWESIGGRLFCDETESWCTWTGQVRQLEVPSLATPPPAAIERRSADRQDRAPELLPGCKVSRVIVAAVTGKGDEGTQPEYSKKARSGSIDAEDNNSIGSSLESALRAFGDSHRRNLERHSTSHSYRTASAEKSAQEEAASATAESASSEQIGTVMDITAWPDDLPGTARVIRWDDGTTETVRWGAHGNFYDVVQLRMSNGKIAGRYPKPVSRDVKILNSTFGNETVFGVILRLRNIPKLPEDDEEILHRLVGVIEWPDFNAIVYVQGHKWNDNHTTIIEKKIIRGPPSSVWGPRFGDNNWQPGTTYDFMESRSLADSTDASNCAMIGQFSVDVNVAHITAKIVGEITVQRGRLFYFDSNRHSAAAVLACDQMTVSKQISSSGQVCTFANVGFSTGIHYWEFKIEQADVGSIFVGVSEKPVSTILPKDLKWSGYGFVNDRKSYKSGSQTSTERVAVYGDHFHTGDLVGVMLDLNKGRLSFFLDGLKYGQHGIADLGEAFSNMCLPNSVKPRTYYPIVGLGRQDRVTITPRWLSSIGSHPEEEQRILSKAWGLLSSWTIERPTSTPSTVNMWAYRDGWRDWRRWLSGKYIRVKSRCKAASVLLNVTPRACAGASIRLGLSTALYRGDRVVFTMSSGRRLESKEEAVILGAYEGRLWYRLDNQQGDGALMENSSLAWCLVPNDVEGMTLLRRSSSVPAAVAEILLPRLKQFQGGLICLSHQQGAVMRNGLEIDTAERVADIPSQTTLHAIERRVNASNIVRYKVVHDGKCGWISERMRGGSEEIMLHHVNSASPAEVREALQHLVKAASDIGVTDRILWDDVNTFAEAMDHWTNAVNQVPGDRVLESGQLLSCIEAFVFDCTDLTFEKYLSLATTMDAAGSKNWMVEGDMLLSELISRSSSQEGVIPQNLSVASLIRALKSIDSPTSILLGVDHQRAVARAALLRVANQVIAYALPYMNVKLLEESYCKDVCGSGVDVDMVTTVLPAMACAHTGDSDQDKDKDHSHSTGNSKPTWAPPCNARRLRSLRRVLFSQTKHIFWESVLEASTTVTPLDRDEYEDPREIRTISINRVKATTAKLAAISNPHERFKRSVFGQLHKDLKGWTDASFRRSYVCKGHGGQKRAFKVKFMGEGVNDYGGPYRAVFEQIVDELQSDTVMVGQKPSEKCLLPLLVPCSNRTAAAGPNQDKFVLSTSSQCSPLNQELMQFFGKLVGMAVRNNLNLALDLSAMFWRPLVRLPLARGHVETVDTLTCRHLTQITEQALAIEHQHQQQHMEMSAPSGIDSGEMGEQHVLLDDNYSPAEWKDINFTTYLPDGSKVQLIIGGENEMLNMGNWRRYVALVEKSRVRDSAVMFKAMRDGLASVVPTELLAIFTPAEVEQVLSGSACVNVTLLKQCTEYEDISADAPVVINFWNILEEMSSEDRTMFLRFVWARSRMPGAAQDLPMNFKIQGPQGAAKDKPDDYLPHAQTCFFSLSLPHYTTRDILKAKLLYAIHNSPNMDADVRLHSAEGWADS